MLTNKEKLKNISKGCYDLPEHLPSFFCHEPRNQIPTFCQPQRGKFLQCHNQLKESCHNSNPVTSTLNAKQQTDKVFVSR